MTVYAAKMVLPYCGFLSPQPKHVSLNNFGKIEITSFLPLMSPAIT